MSAPSDASPPRGLGDFTKVVEAALFGQTLRVTKREYDWDFTFSKGGGLSVFCAWRVVANGRLVVSERDHGHLFGLSEPVDAERVANDLLRNKTIAGIALREDTGDITIAFNNQTTMEVWNNSGGHEGWHLSLPSVLWAVAMGGGELAIWDAPNPR